MITKVFDTEEEWMAARAGKITGSRLNNIVTKRGNGKKIGYYELIAEKLGAVQDDENAMERGKRLEEEAMEKFVTETGKKVQVGNIMWMREDDNNIAISPDGVIGKTEAVEVKCLNSARHIEALLTNEVPGEYEMQVLQYFIVNEKLETLYLAFYDPRLPVKSFFYLTIKRNQVDVDIRIYLEYQRQTLAEINDVIKMLCQKS